jgi:hypothetical protein
MVNLDIQPLKKYATTSCELESILRPIIRRSPSSGLFIPEEGDLLLYAYPTR